MATRAQRFLWVAASAVLLSVSYLWADALFVVDGTADGVDDNTGNGFCHTAAGTCTLRAAVIKANRSSGTGTATILLPTGIYLLTIPIRPGGDDDESKGDLNLTSFPSPVTIAISGAGASRMIIDGNHQSGIFNVESSRLAVLSGFTLRKGLRSLGSGGGTYSYEGSVTVSHCRITGNQAQFDGGGIANYFGILRIDHSTVSGNSGGSGGGLFNLDGLLIVDQSTVSDNTSASEGGGSVSTLGTMYLSLITLSGNRANGDGGEICNVNDGTAWIYNSTIVFNEADTDADFDGSGAGVYNDSSGNFNLCNSVVAGNNLSGAPIDDDCTGPIHSYGRTKFWNYSNCTISQPTGIGDSSLLASLAELGPLQFNGGVTRTHALVAPSNMIDGGEATQGCVGRDGLALLVDHRGGPRSVGVRFDVGAFETDAHPTGLILADGFESGDLRNWG